MWHGTFVSGIIAADRDGIGMVGVAYDAKLLPHRPPPEEQLTPSNPFRRLTAALPSSESELAI